MIELPPPILAIAMVTTPSSRSKLALTKGCVSSLLRSLFGGQISVFRNHELPVFKVERSALTEVLVPSSRTGSLPSVQLLTRERLFTLSDMLAPESRQWVFIADAASVALRNIDHLIPPDFVGPYAPPDVDFYWAGTGGVGLSNSMVTPGIWAVRGAHLPLVLERWKEAWSVEAEDQSGWRAPAL